MYDRTYGSSYDSNLTTTSIAKPVRKEIAALKKAGTLAKGWKISVRSEYFSMGSAIRLSIVEIPADVEPWNQERTDRTEARYSPEVVRVQKLILDIVAAYNHDGSDSMIDYFDVKFYCNGCGLAWDKFPEPQEVS